MWAENREGRPEGRPPYSFHIVVDELFATAFNVVPNRRRRKRGNRSASPRLVPLAEAKRATGQNRTSDARKLSNRCGRLSYCPEALAAHSNSRTHS
jgi:hypothetical protein